MAKISIYPEWVTQIPTDAFYLIAYNGKNYKVKQQNVSGSGGGSGNENPINGDWITDYIYDLLEIPDGINKIFTLRYDYKPSSCKVYLRGLRQTLSRSEDEYDYQEIGNKQIQFTDAPKEGSLIVVDYIYDGVINNNCSVWVDFDDAQVIDDENYGILIDQCL